MENMVNCNECGKELPLNEVISFEGANICAQCKPLIIQKLKEGVTLPGKKRFAGFWIRFGAKIIDWLILWVFTLMGGFITGSMFDSSQIIGITVTKLLFQMVTGASYTAFFLGKYSATPGKMACKIEVILSDNKELTYMRALGRHFAEIISSIILMIGYIMAAFDDEKRALHDRICNSRVVFKEAFVNI